MFKSGFKEAALLFAVAIVCCCGPHMISGQDFGYVGNMGPSHWGEQYNTCDGKYQSPININILDVVERPFEHMIMKRFNETPSETQLLNNGHTVVVRLEYADGPPTIEGGALEGRGAYKFSQFHFHWGENDTVGSEDRINNISFPAELHMVFYSDKYDTFKEALQQNSSVAVLAFFFNIQEEDNLKYAEFTELLGSLREPHMLTSFTNPPKLENFITEDIQSYFTYTGSLTTPPCSEDVTWIDFDSPIMISKAQIEPFRRLLTHDGIPLTHNFRPIQPLNNRTVYRAMPMMSTAFQTGINQSATHDATMPTTTRNRSRISNFIHDTFNGAPEVPGKSILHLLTAYLLVQSFSLYI